MNNLTSFLNVILASINKESDQSNISNKSEFYWAGYKQGKEDFSNCRLHKSNSHSILITSLQSYNNMVDFEEGYNKAYPKAINNYA